jgi:hypothetical protein
VLGSDRSSHFLNPANPTQASGIPEGAQQRQVAEVDSIISKRMSSKWPLNG